MKSFYFSVILVVSVFNYAPAMAQDCTISGEEEARLMALPYIDFDQSLGNGWRAYGDRGCFTLSAALLDRCYALHHDTMEPKPKRIVNFHAGQMYAFANRYELAKDRFRNSFDLSDTPDPTLLWNNYVSATLAFLGKDVESLRLHRDRIAQGPTRDGKPPNLDVVNGLIRCIDKPYSVAYSDGACRG